MEEGKVYELDLNPLGDSDELDDDFFELVERDENEKSIIDKIMILLPFFSKNELIVNIPKFKGETTGDSYYVTFTNKEGLGILCDIDADRMAEIRSDEVFSWNAKEVLEDDCYNFYAVEDYNVRDDS